MLLLSSLLFALTLFLRFGPDVPFRRMLNEQLVEKPLLWFSQRERHDFLYFIIASAMFIGGGEMILIMGPEFVMWYAADLALYLDALAVGYLLSAVAAVKAAARSVRTRLANSRNRVSRLFRRGPRQRTSRRRVASRRSDNDDDGGGWQQLPMAA